MYDARQFAGRFLSKNKPLATGRTNSLWTFPARRRRLTTALRIVSENMNEAHVVVLCLSV